MTGLLALFVVIYLLPATGSKTDARCCLLIFGNFGADAFTCPAGTFINATRCSGIMIFVVYFWVF